MAENESVNIVDSLRDMVDSILARGVSITYEPVREIRLPEKVEFSGWFAPGVAIVKSTSFFSGEKFGVFSVEKGLVTEIKYQKTEVTPSGYLLLTGKGNALVSPEGILLAGDECDGIRDLKEGFYAKKIRKLWSIYSAADQSCITKSEYTEVSDFSEGTCAVTSRSGVQLIGTDGMPLFDEIWEEAHPFREGFARVKANNESRYINREGKIIYSGTGRSYRDFCGGYAVFEDKKGKHGAINTDGVVIIKPEYLFLRDSASNMFVAAHTGGYAMNPTTKEMGFQSSSYGLIRADGTSVLPFTYDRIVDQPDGFYRYGHAQTWTIGQTGYAVFVYGLVSPEGEVLFTDQFVDVGPESEGLRACKRLGSNQLYFGYMKPDGSIVFEIGATDYKSASSNGWALMQESISTQLCPFKDGKARVSVVGKERDPSGGFFSARNPVWDATVKTGWYEIDRNGKRIGKGQDLRKQFEDRRNTPFFNEFCDNARYRESNWENFIRPFDDMYEVHLSPWSFAILNRDLDIICMNHPQAKPRASDLNCPAIHETCNIVSQISPNVWTVVTDKEAATKISEFESPTRFSCGLAAFCTARDSKHPLWGYMDSRGNTVIEAKYTYATPFRDNCAVVRDEKGPLILYRKANVIPPEE